MYTLNFYVRSSDSHPADFAGEGLTLDEVFNQIKQCFANLNTGASFNCVISWIGRDGGRASLRSDSFTTNGSFRCCQGHDEEAGVLKQLLAMRQQGLN